MPTMEMARELRVNAETQPELWRRLHTTYTRMGMENEARLAEARALQYENGPVEVLKVIPEWHDRYANSPSIKVLLSRRVDPKEYIYTQKGSLYFTQVYGVCSHFHYSSPGQGYGGRHFKILLDTGEEKTLIGPWSSGSYAMNEAGFGPVMEASITDDPNVMGRGYTFYAGAILVDKVLPKLKEMGLGLALMESNCYQPTSRAKYPDNAPYYDKANNSGPGSFTTVKKEILAPTD